MGPIEGSTFTSEQLAKLLQNEEVIKGITDVLRMHVPGGWDDLGAFTSSGRDIKNLSTSAAKLGSTTGEYLGIAEGRTPASLSRQVISAKTENAILRAAQALAAETPKVTPPEVPPTPKISPKIAPPVAPGASLLQILNRLATGVQLATYSGDLNSGEDARLAQYRLDDLRSSGGPR